MKQYPSSVVRCRPSIHGARIKTTNSFFDGKKKVRIRIQKDIAIFDVPSKMYSGKLYSIYHESKTGNAIQIECVNFPIGVFNAISQTEEELIISLKPIEDETDL